jgi:hypothetical protein
VEKLGISYIHENIKWYSKFGRQFDHFLFVKNKFTEE